MFQLIHKIKSAKALQLLSLAFVVLANASCHSSNIPKETAPPQQPAKAQSASPTLSNPATPSPTTSNTLLPITGEDVGRENIKIYNLIDKLTTKARKNHKKAVFLIAESHQNTLNAFADEAAVEVEAKDFGLSAVVEMDAQEIAKFHALGTKMQNEIKRISNDLSVSPYAQNFIGGMDPLVQRQAILALLLNQYIKAVDINKVVNADFLHPLQVLDGTKIYPGDPQHQKRTAGVDIVADPENPKLMDPEAESAMAEAIYSAAQQSKVGVYAVIGEAHIKPVVDFLTNHKRHKNIEFTVFDCSRFKPKTDRVKARVSFTRQHSTLSSLMDREDINPSNGLLIALSMATRVREQTNKIPKQAATKQRANLLWIKQNVNFQPNH